MKKNRLEIGCMLFVILYLLSAILFYYIGGEQLKYKSIITDMTEQNGITGEIHNDSKIVQTFTTEADYFEKITLLVATFARENTGYLNVKIVEHDTNKVLGEKKLDVHKFSDNSECVIDFTNPIENVKNKELDIIVSASESKIGNAVTLYYNSDAANEGLIINGKKVAGKLCYSTEGRGKLAFGTHYWKYVSTLGAIIVLYCINLIYKNKKNKKSFGLNILLVYKKYKFLIKQLISRDFKTKYKRSALGFLWSFLNPVLTMSVQYIVFSTIFKSDIKNFPVYLLTGIIFFGFFNEAVSVGLLAIVSNSTLITKVYVPKYIYPLTKVFATSINLFISIIPLLIAVVITGEHITKSIILLPFGIICIIIFCMGVTLAMSAAMVFFRDTQFLWSIVSMLWMYATPIIYPESILAPQYRFLLKLNPMYYFIKFIRIILLDGISPEPIFYMICLASALLSLFIGAFVFKKTQDKFVLYI